MKRHSSIVFLYVTLLVALAVQTANAAEIHSSKDTKQITKLRIGKFFLECTGNCSDDFQFREKGTLRFGTDKKVISEDTYTYNIINDFPEDGRIPHFCHDGKPQIEIGKPLYPYKNAHNTFSFFNKNPTSIGVYTSGWGATGWGNSQTHIFDTVTGKYFTVSSGACAFPEFVAMNDGVEYYVNYTFTGFLGNPNFSLVYLNFPSSAKDLKHNNLKKELLSSYEYFYNKHMGKGWFSPRELQEIEKLFSYWESHKFKTNSDLFDQGQQNLLERFVVMIGFDMLHTNGLKNLKNYFNSYNNTNPKVYYKSTKAKVNLVKKVAMEVAGEFSYYFEDYMFANFMKRYGID